MSRQEVLENLDVYESMRSEFEAKHLHKWVVFADKQLVGVYDTNVEATSAAIQRFGEKPFLVHEVRKTPVPLPSSLIFGQPRAGR